MTVATHPFEALMDITGRPPAVFVRGQGSFLWDDTGKRYLDFVQGWAVNCLGHSPPVLREALAAQAGTPGNASPALFNESQLALGGALAAATRRRQVFLAPTGARANEGAVAPAPQRGRP